MPLKRPLFWALKAAIVPWEWLSPPLTGGQWPQALAMLSTMEVLEVLGDFLRGKTAENFEWKPELIDSENFWRNSVGIWRWIKVSCLLDDEFRMTNNPTAEMIPCQINKASVWWFMNLIQQIILQNSPHLCKPWARCGFDPNSMARCARIPLPSALPSLPAKEVHDKHWARNDSDVLFVGWWF